ncbi:unnamed protein product [Gongylonema pulchrum]|uniref:Ovule protein n=1 Tax=Gongylonema pulchrum TaxID=637853 RepID=A0A183D167_9BILA|nr:unnamed protein product [Gongylonema pulchrum]
MLLSSGIRSNSFLNNSGNLPLGNRRELLHHYLQVPQSRVSLSGRSSPSIVSMQSDPESCLDDTRFPDDLFEPELLGL